jgi:hypothetical protein
MTSIKFKLRKLCSSIEEYEANASGRPDLDLLAQRLSDRPGIELFRHGSVLTILFEHEGVTVRLFADGRALVQAGLRENAEQACKILEDAFSNDRVLRDQAERI